MAIGDEWSMKVSLPPVSFGVGRPVRPEMVDAVNLALDEDVKYEMPKNYLRGEGDSEFTWMYVFTARLVIGSLTSWLFVLNGVLKFGVWAWSAPVESTLCWVQRQMACNAQRPAASRGGKVVDGVLMLSHRHG